MNISLTPTLEAMVQAKVASGLYNNASEVIREALRLLNEHDQLKALKLEMLQKEFSFAASSLNTGEVSSRSISNVADKVLDNIRAQPNEAKKQA